MKKGDIVVLNSGSPLMTIRFSRENGTQVSYYWHPYKNVFHEVEIHEELLSIANEWHSPVYFSEEISPKDRFHRR